MQEDYFNRPRNSFIKTGCIYFWTATINNWYKLLEDDVLKQIVIDSLNYLSQKQKISVYGFVIMPNHIHLIWQIHELNGKETAQGSFLKFTAHAFKYHLKKNNPDFLQFFKVDASNKSYEFWQRDPLAFELTQRETAIQKLEYIHNNPMTPKWLLAKCKEDYYYSSAAFYAAGVNDFGFLKHIMDVF